MSPGTRPHELIGTHATPTSTPTNIYPSCFPARKADGAPPSPADLVSLASGVSVYILVEDCASSSAAPYGLHLLRFFSSVSSGLYRELPSIIVSVFAGHKCGFSWYKKQHCCCKPSAVQQYRLHSFEAWPTSSETARTLYNLV